MTNGNVKYDTESKFVQLDERVNNIGQRFSAMEANVSRSFQSIESTLDSLAKEISAASQTSWSTIAAWASCALVLLSMIGTLAFWPISSATGELKASMMIVNSEAVFHRQYDADVIAARQDIKDRIGALADRVHRLEDKQ